MLENYAHFLCWTTNFDYILFDCNSIFGFLTNARMLYVEKFFGDDIKLVFGVKKTILTFLEIKLYLMWLYFDPHEIAVS